MRLLVPLTQHSLRLYDKIHYTCPDPYEGPLVSDSAMTTTERIAPLRKTATADTVAASTTGGVSFSICMGKPKFLQWFAYDARRVGADCAGMTGDQEATYHRLMRYLWDEGPQQEHILRGRSFGNWEAISHCFTPSGEGISLAWLEEYRSRACATSERQRNNRGATMVKPSTDHGKSTEAPSREEEEQESKKKSNRKSVAPEARELVFPTWAGENTKAKWEEFKTYKRQQHKFTYRSPASEQAALNLLAKYYTNGKDCVAELDLAMAKGWMFPVDPAEQPTRNGFRATNAKPSYGREEAEAERLAIRLKRGKDPVWGGVDDQDKSRELLIYEGKIKP